MTMDLLRQCAIVVMCVTAANAHIRCPRGNNNMPGREKGLPFPPDKCVVPIEDFLKHADGKIYVSAYTIDTLRFTSGISTQRRFKALPDGRINATFSFAVGDNCQSYDVLYPKICGDSAVFPQSAPGQEERDFRVLSCSPADYLITYHCRDTTKIVCGKCPKVAVVLYIPDRRIDTNGDGIPDGDPDFTGVPWGRIERFSKHCLGEEFYNNDDVGWVWKGRAQPTNCTLKTQ